MTVMIIAITGMPGSRKSDVASMLSKKMQINSYTLSDVIREELHNRREAITPLNIWKFSLSLRKRHGPDIIARKLYQNIRNKEKAAIVDGVRSPEEVAFLRKKSKLFLLVGVFSDPETRFQRLFAGNKRKMNLMKRLDAANLSLGLGEVIVDADCMILNDRVTHDLEKQVDRFVEYANSMLQGSITDVGSTQRASEQIENRRGES
jgi:dephospho-CoA kinase